MLNIVMFTLIVLSQINFFFFFFFFTNRQTDIERKQYLRHLLRSLGEDDYLIYAKMALYFHQLVGRIDNWFFTRL